jgi:sugar phosphate isomerase/epimerase
MKFAICNEQFEGWDFERICRYVKSVGYEGLEVAPFTLAPRITDVDKARRAELRRHADSAGIRIIGLHWLLAGTEGFYLTSPDDAVRARTAQYLVDLAEATKDLGGDLMVFGSPKQRSLLDGVTWDQAFAHATDTFRRAMPGIAAHGISLCMEPLGPSETDFINTADEGARLMEAVGHPNFVLHLDVKAMSSESQPIPDIIRQYANRTGHFHANDPNRRGPGFGDVDFVPIFRALNESGYDRWVSVEVFDYTPDPETIAEKSIEYMQGCAARA